MALNTPDKSIDVVSRVQTNVKGELSNSNPWLNGGFIRALCTSVGLRIFDTAYFQLKRLVKNIWPFDAEREYLKFWADLKAMTPDVAEKAEGLATFTGENGTDVSVGTIVTLGDLEYETTAAETISTVALAVDSLTRVGSVAYCVTLDEHHLATGMTGTISGAVQTAWNTAQGPITVTGEKSFSFSVSNSLTTPATGTIEFTHVSASVQVRCTVATVDGNQYAGTELAMQSTTAGIDDAVVVQWGGLTGGYDAQTDEEHQDAVVDRWQNPQTPFNVPTIKAAIRAIGGNTRVWVHKAFPAAGEVTVYFVRDNEESIIPTAEDEAAALAAILEFSPSNTLDEDVHVSGPVAIPIDVIISNVVPATRTMQTAVINSIDAFFRGELGEGENFDTDRLKAAIYRSYDYDRGASIIWFVMEAPTENAEVNRGFIATAGTVSVTG